MYGIASNKEASVASSLEWLGIEERRSWNVHFIQRPKWVVLMNFFVLLVQIYLPLRMEIVCDESWQRMGILISIHFTISWEALCPLFFLRKVFGRLRLLSVFPSLCGLLYGIGSLQVTIWGVEGWFWLTGVSCAVVMGGRWIICYFIVVRLIGYEVWCLDLLGFLGSCQDQLQILYLVGGIGLESMCLAFGT